MGLPQGRLPVLPQETHCLLELMGEPVNLFHGVGEAQAGPGRTRFFNKLLEAVQYAKVTSKIK